MISVDTITSFQEFQELKDNWEQVYRQDDEADYFLSWSWLSQLYENSAESVLILAVKNSTSAPEYCAFLPLRFGVRFSESRGGFFNNLSMIGGSWADSTGLLCDPAVEAQAIPVLAHSLKWFSWHQLAFTGLNMSDSRKALLMEPFARQNYHVTDSKPASIDSTLDVSVSPYVKLPETFELFLKKTVNSDISKNIVSLRKAIDNEDKISIEVADKKSIGRCLEFLKNADVDAGKGIHDQPDEQVLSTYADLIKAGVLCDEMLVVVMLRDNSPIGFFACYKDVIKKQLIFYVAAYNDEFGNFQGGLALHAFCIEWAIDNGYAGYQLLRGDEPHKYLLGAQNATRSDLVVFDRTPPPMAQLLTHYVKAPSLALLGEHRDRLAAADVHKLYSQLLESWPNDTSVLEHYADWLKSVQQLAHEKDIRDHLANAPDVVNEHRPVDAHAETPKVDIVSYTEIHQWLESLASKQQTLANRCAIDVKGLQLHIASSEADSLYWLRSYLYPLVDINEENDVAAAGPSDDVELSARDTSSYRLDCICASDMVVEIMRLAASGTLQFRSMELGSRRISRLFLRSNLIIDICKKEGVVWVSDNERRHLTVLVSGRTTWPALELARTGRALLIAYLQQEGWSFLHSGAVRFDNKNYLVIGDEGKGKTSLILALMSAGCEFISNERVFARATKKGVEAVSFPMPVAIGMGTAQQYPDIMQYVYRPERCLYPNRRMNIQRLRATPEAKWASLRDKVQLLVPELNAVFGHSKAVQGGGISGVIVPAIVKDGDATYKDKAVVLEQEYLRKVVTRNRISTKRDSRYPAWLPLAFEPLSEDSSTGLTKAICRLPSVGFKYFAAKDRHEQVMRYPSILRKKLHAQDKKS